MACVILIHVLNKKEKLEIIDSFRDSLDYEIVADLKKYVEEKYKGKFVKDEEDDVESTQTDPLTTNVPEEDGHGTFIPYRDRMIEPKEEDLADEAITKIDKLTANIEEGGRIGEPQFEDIAHNEIVTADPFVVDNTFSIDNISTSTATRSGRVLKRPKHLMDDDDWSEDVKVAKPRQQPASKKQKSMNDDVSIVDSSTRSGRNEEGTKYATDEEESDGEDDSTVSTGIKCEKCFEYLGANKRDDYNKKDHAIIHTGLVRYACPVNECDFKCWSYLSLDGHTRKIHGRHLSAEKIDLTDEQEEELDRMVKECFPVYGPKDKSTNDGSETTENTYKTCALCQAAVSSNNLNQQHLKSHSLQHIDFMLYKCNQPNCEYNSKYYRLIRKHGRKTHKIEEISKEETEVELTDDQKNEIDDMMERCFPTNDINNTVSAGVECKKCLKKLSCKSYTDAKLHAIIHTELKRYECPVDGCDHNNGNREPVQKHIRIKHDNCGLSARKIDLTTEQEEQLVQVTKECFPDIKKRDEYKINNTAKPGMKCKKCSKQLSCKSYSDARQHAITHTDLMDYECPVNGCDHKSKHCKTMQDHLRLIHNNCILSSKKINLTDEQKQKLYQMVKECFPEVEGKVSTGDDYKTCTICQVAVSNKSFDQYNLKRHLVQHIDFMLYKCNQSKCTFECKSYKHMIEHGRYKHNIEELSKEETEIELNDDQKKEIDDIFKKCFPITDSSNTVKTGIECKKCMKQLNAKYKAYYNAKEHAITHTELKRYECPVDGCDYKGVGVNHMKYHTQAKHGNRRLPTKKINLTDEQEEELDRMTKECFPEFSTGDKYKVCTVCETASVSQQHLKRHSLTHINFMLYKCIQPGCQYGAKYYHAMKEHGRNKHKIEEMSKEETTVKLTDDQEKEIDEMLKRCFPDEE